jgi:hypothetical protein
VSKPLDRVLQSWAQQLWAGLLAGAGAHRAGAGALDVDSGWMLHEWERELFERLLAQARGGSVRFVESSTGGGRSHFLALLEARARAAGLATVVLPAGSQADVWRDPLELYRRIAATLLPGSRPVQPGLPALVLASTGQQAARAELFPELPLWGLALELWATRQQPEARQLLLGQTPGPQASELGLHCGLSSGQGLPALRCLLQYLDFCGERGLLVLGDGDGWIEESHERATLEGLRNLIDSCAGAELPGLLLVFAVLPGFRRQLLPEYEALQQRLHNGFAAGPAGCLRPILILEEQRRWRATQGVRFAEGLLWAIHRLALHVHPELDRAPAILRRNAEAMLEELPWGPAEPGAARGLSRTIARWFDELSLPLDSSEPDEHSRALARFLEREAL